MEWFKKHVDTVVVLGCMASGFLWMSGKFAALEKDIAVMKAVMVLKNIMPKELATSESK
jgi:hypothetical protein